MIFKCLFIANSTYTLVTLLCSIFPSLGLLITSNYIMSLPLQVFFSRTSFEQHEETKKANTKWKKTNNCSSFISEIMNGNEFILISRKLYIFDQKREFTLIFTILIESQTIGRSVLFEGQIKLQ